MVAYLTKSDASEGFNQIINFLNGSSINLVRNVDSPTRFYMYPHFLQLMIRKQVGDLSTHTTKYTSPALTQKVFANIRRVGDADENDENVNAGYTAEGDVSVAHGEVSTVAEESSIPSPTPPTPTPQPSHDTHSLPKHNQHHHNHLKVKKLERRNKVKVLKLRRLQKVGTTQRVEKSNETVMDDVSNQGRMVVEMDQDADVVFEEAKEVAEDAKEDESEPAKVQEVLEVCTTAKIITEVVTAASETITTASETISAVEAQVPAVTLTAIPARVTATPNHYIYNHTADFVSREEVPTHKIHSKSDAKG
nr:hypothetical protein [Tanacetum cinerariifolium]